MIDVFTEKWPNHEVVILLIPKTCSCIVYNYPLEQESFISTVYTQPDFRNKGHMSTLLDVAEVYCRYPISVSVANDAPKYVIDMYRKRNYNIIKEE